jgi:hypothetical protein
MLEAGDGRRDGARGGEGEAKAKYDG